MENLLIMLSLLTLLSCSFPAPKNGDLVFVVGSESEMSEAIYCSELVWYSFIDNDGEALFDAAPMNFKGADGSFPDFWIELFAEMGQPIPQGEPGTNPNHMAQESILTEVCRIY